MRAKMSGDLGRSVRGLFAFDDGIVELDHEGGSLFYNISIPLYLYQTYLVPVRGHLGREAPRAKHRLDYSPHEGRAIQRTFV